ncbi:MAG: guanylate kinase [Candidatus Gracilibacteria bacterium]|nr:guanylate kinase [Candidatus Gracilibacteria bacterium]
MSHIFFIMGVSGAGKGTLIKTLKNLEGYDFHIPLSYKTRNIREGEVNGVDSWFISKEQFFSEVQEGLFLEYAMVHGLDYYGTKFEDVIDNGINLGKIVIKELDINGLEELRKLKPEFDKKYTTIFLNIPNEVLKKRIESRGAFMSNDELQKRLNSAIMEEQKARVLCDYIIDATKTQGEVLEDFLKILNNKK